MLPFVFCNLYLSCVENLDVVTDDLHLGDDGDVLFRAHAHCKQGIGRLGVRHLQGQGISHALTFLTMDSDNVGITGDAAQ